MYQDTPTLKIKLHYSALSVGRRTENNVDKIWGKNWTLHTCTLLS